MGLNRSSDLSQWLNRKSIGLTVIYRSYRDFRVISCSNKWVLRCFKHQKRWNMGGFNHQKWGSHWDATDKWWSVDDLGVAEGVFYPIWPLEMGNWLREEWEEFFCLLCLTTFITCKKTSFSPRAFIFQVDRRKTLELCMVSRSARRVKKLTSSSSSKPDISHSTPILNGTFPGVFPASAKLRPRSMAFQPSLEAQRVKIGEMWLVFYIAELWI